MTLLYSDFLRTMTDCPFCGNTLRNRMLIERKHAYLTYALAPYHKHHLLVIPRRHVLSIAELLPEEERDIEELQRLGLDMLNKLHYTSITLMVREGKIEKNKSIDHTHFHIVPYIQIGDLDHFGKPRRILSDKEVEETIEELQRVLSK